MIVAGVMEVVVLRRAHVQRAHRWLAWSWATFLPAYALWWLDLHRVVCNPAAHVMNGHAAWHLLMAASLYFVHRFHAELGAEAAQARIGCSAIALAGASTRAIAAGSGLAGRELGAAKRSPS